jgi:hypothetical protein
MLGLAMVNLITSDTILYALLFPVLFIALAFLALKQPMLAAILSILLFAGIIIINIIAFGGVGAIRGIIVKAVIIYFLLAAVQSARTAEQAKKDMQ